MFFRKRTPNPTPPWVTWLVIGFVIFAVFSNQHKGGQVNKTVQTESKNLAPSKLLHFDDYKKVFAYDDYLQIKELSPGQGTPVICGQQVKIAYTASLTDGTALQDQASKEAPLTFRAGSAETITGLSRGVIGMQPGSKRGVVVPASMTSGLKDSNHPQSAPVFFTIELMEASPKLPDIDASPFRITNVRTGAGPIIACNETAHIHVTLWSVDGKKLYSSRDKEPLSITPGQSNVAIGVEQGVLGMAPGSVRTLIIPPAFQKTMNGNASKISLPFPVNQTVLMDVEYVP
jgi:FKBP-type peptidyl-prolyl cis-trans isomerase